MTVKGSGYDAAKGVYVTLCKDNGPGQKPTPCVGGASAAAGAWFSNNPVALAQGARSYPTVTAGKAAFNAVLTLKAKDQTTDCTKIKCVISTRADHFSPGDRTQDVRIPVTWAKTPTRVVGFDATPEPVRKGRKIAVRGKLESKAGPRWAAVPRQKVTFYFKAAGTARWVKLRTVATGPQGWAKTTFIARRDGQWKAVYAGDRLTKAAQSKPDYVDVR